MGHHNRHFAGDKYALQGAWSPPSSTANFCEEDYVLSYYLAEGINSITNLAYVFFALRFMYGSGSGRGLLSPRLDPMAVSLLVLGINSFLFHASLRHTLQFADEVSMLGLAGSILRGILAVRQSASTMRHIDVALATLISATSVIYVWTDSILFHVTVFACMIVIIVARGHYLFEYLQPPLPPAKLQSWRRRGRRSLYILLVGYLLWHIDLEYCHMLRQLRQQLGMPMASLLELHGWWHVLTAISASRFMDIVREIQSEENATHY